MSSRSLPIGDRDRVAWLDVLRLLCALQIIGFHWLRAGFANGLFGSGDQANLVWSYRNAGLGLGQLHYLLLDHGTPGVDTLMTNVLGVAFGFGWQAVNVFILVSGLLLALTTGTNDRPGWWGWYTRRLKRIVVPFYVVSLPMVLAAHLFVAWAHDRAGTLGSLAAKVQTLTSDGLLASLLKHLTFIDPTQHHGIAAFFSPAWWFIPAILVAYLCFPLLSGLFDRFGARVVLLMALFVSIASYSLTNLGYLVENAWYFVVLHELFGFSVGVAVGRAMRTSAGCESVRLAIARPAALFAGAVILTFGNAANWFHMTYPISSPLITIGFTLLLSWFAIRLVNWPPVLRLSHEVDAYYLYLVHQPLAFPFVVLLAGSLGSLTMGFGFVVYVVLTFIVAWLLGRVMMVISAFGRPVPAQNMAMLGNQKLRVP